jgi:hypothetical protein
MDATPEYLSTGMQVALATLALLCYRLLFHSSREPSISALLICAACAWCVGQLAGGAQVAFLSTAAVYVGSGVRFMCQYVGLDAAARDACWRHTAVFMGVNQSNF